AGTTASADATVTIEQEQLEPIVADFSLSQNPDNPFNFTFVASAQGGTGSFTYSWDFGDGQSQTDLPTPDVAHTYGNTGSYTVTLTVNDGQETVPVSRNLSITQQSITPILPDIEEVSSDLTQIYNAATNPDQETPRDTSSIAIIGDQTATDPNFLAPFASGRNYTLADGTDQLQSVITRFENSLDQRRSLSNINEMIQASPRPECEGQTELVCYINERNAITVIIGVGYQDALNMTNPAEFADRLTQAINQAKGANAVPVLLTLYPSNDATMQEGINAINQVIIDVGASNNVPVINVWRGLSGLPDNGISGTTPNVDPSGEGFLSPNTQGGINAMNFFTLSTLNDIVNQVFD
ncbi:MAG: PKD domain-containing protein, partial [Anaerolineaceae bacterium]